MDTSFKGEVISDFDNGECQETKTEKYRVDQSQISRRIKNQTIIMQDAASSYRKLYRKGTNIIGTSICVSFYGKPAFDFQ